MLIFTLLLVVQLVYSATRLAYLSAPDAISPAADALQVKSALAVDTVLQEHSEEIRKRPLFWAGRRPAVSLADSVEPVAGEAKVQEIEGIELLGIFGGGDSAGIIALADKKEQRVLVGQKLKGWKLESVDTDAAVLAAGARRVNLQLQQRSVAPTKRGGAKAPRTRKDGAGRTRDLRRELFRQRN